MALVIEDLHWADRSTLDLLTFLVRNLGSAPLLVMTYRTDDVHRRHPLRPFLAELDRSGRVERLDVDRFNRAEIADLLQGSVGSSPADDVVERIYRRSGGNAFFAEELLAAAREENGNPQLPPSLENVLLSRVQILSENAQATLRIAAAASGPVPHQLLAAVSDLPEPNLLAALREAVAHQVLVPDPATETYSFRHALSQEHQINYEATASVSGAPMIMRILIMSRDSNRDTCIWLVPISSAISAWERCS
jgi:predicted ATPase